MSTQTTINIFIASSYELAEQRELIGDYIRRLSYDYTPRGIRIRMACWEDFQPEYVGMSKQEEYDEQLIRTCDIFVAIFKTRCGRYTQHEVQLALSLNKECHILQIPTEEEHNELNGFLTGLNLPVCHCTENNIMSCINDIVNDYIHSHNLSLSTNATPTGAWRLYATIPDDYTELRLPLSNMIRGLEYTLEETLGNYFILHPYHTTKNIASTDHFICFIKDSWTSAEEDEVRMAYQNCHDVNIPETAILYQIEGHSGEERNQLAININSEYQAFSKTYSNLDTVRCDLTMWAMRHKFIVASDNKKVFSIEGENICLYGRPFFYLPMFPTLQKSIKTIVNGIENIDNKIKRNIKGGRVKNQELAVKLAKKRSDKEIALQNEISNWYNKTQLQQSTNSIWTKTQIESVKDEQLRRYKELTNSINVEIKLYEYDCNIQHLKSLAPILLDWESAADVCLSSKSIKVQDYIQVLTCIIQICDTYLHPLGLEFDEDAVFKKIVDAADQYNYHTLFTEVMRVNHANSYAKRLDYESAGELYKEAYKQILQINDESVQAHYYKSYVISYLLHYYVETDDKQAVLELGGKYESLIQQWRSINQQISYDVDLARCYSCVLAAAPKYYGVCIDLVEQAERLLENLHKKYDSRPYDDDYYDAICHFSIVLSTYFIDRYEKGNDAYYDKALRYIKESMDSLRACYPYDPLYIRFSLSQPFHNRAFLYSKNDEWSKAISNYKSALKKRRDIYAETLDEKDLFEIARTCVNLGDVYRLNKKLDKAIECADEALNIYESMRDGIHEIFDMLYYEAYQLKATILMDIDKDKDIYPSKAIAMMRECMDWSNRHPGNDYEDRFKGVSGFILQSYDKG